MNLEQLEAVIGVVEHGSFRAAAEQLNRSQPALSAAIKNLEEEFSVLIFDRSSYRPSLTEAGAAFLSVARSTLQAAQYATRVGIELGRKKAETQLTISVDPLISTEVIEIIAQECSRPVLPVNLIMDKSILKGSYQSLLKGKVDLALATRPNSEELESIHLESVTLVGAVSRRLLQEKRRATETFLKTHTQIWFYDKRFDEDPDELLPDPIHASAGHKIFVADHFTKLRLIEGGVGWGRISKNELEANPELVMIDKSLCAPLTLDLCLIRPRRRPIGPIAREIWKTFQKRQANRQGR
ncbi:MAG: LysR family transcriptional regulator [Proteobacteria bacterium]|nr:MAG: LysR family transcriptional regulator [Pseudomonadota bacterium]